MNLSGVPQSAGLNAATTSRAYVVYDRTTGDILHIHHAVEPSIGGSDPEKHKAQALRMAGARAGANSEILELDSSEVKSLKPIGVDPAKRVIVARAAKSAPSLPI